MTDACKSATLTTRYTDTLDRFVFMDDPRSVNLGLGPRGGALPVICPDTGHSGLCQPHAAFVPNALALLAA